LRFEETVVELVYNRLVDFALEEAPHTALRRACVDGAVVVTPNPRAHALFSDKRNLTMLADPAALASAGLADELRDALSCVPPTVLMTPHNATDLWKRRNSLFFKPVAGYGSRAVYRGDKVTKGAWATIIAGRYVAQELAPPSERYVLIDGSPEPRKTDVRLYVHEGELLLAAARLYRGQATNFRTPGGGFAPVLPL
jgi:DNA-binding transcriptional LysR family regulator